MRKEDWKQKDAGKTQMSLPLSEDSVVIWLSVKSQRGPNNHEVCLGHVRTCQQRALCQGSPFSGRMQGQGLFAGGSPRAHSPSPVQQKHSQPSVSRWGQDNHTGFREFTMKDLIQEPL